MMHRTLCRVFRGTCRKWRDNDCPPVAVGEEVRKNKDQREKEFVPPKHGWEEAVTWTTGLVLAYQVTHRRRRPLMEECPPSAAAISNASIPPIVETSQSSRTCPFSLTSRVLSQPLFAGSTALHVSRTHAVIPSIDVTPFIYDDSQDTELPGRLDTPSVEDEDIIFATEWDLNKDAAPFVTTDGRTFKDPKEYGEKYAADILSVLGAFEFLKTEGQPSNNGRKGRKPRRKSRSEGSSQSMDDPPIHALELMKKGAELGSARALYNIGVAYERMNNSNLAREYYKKAADLGHPLATYNCAVFALQDGHLTQGIALMKMASDFGVPEASEFMKPSTDSMTAQLQVGKV